MYMNLETKLYKICYQEEQFASVGTNCDVWDNLSNEQPELCEYPIFKNAFHSSITKNLDYYGFVSPKFDFKAGIKGEIFLDWVKQEITKPNPKDCYFINPVPIVESLFPGTIQHGEICHPGLLGLLQRN